MLNQKALSYLKKRFTIIPAWKFFLYISLIGGIFTYINILFKPWDFLAQYVEFISLDAKIFMALWIIFPIIILYGLHKKLRIAYDASMVFILIKIIQKIFDIRFYLDYPESSMNVFNSIGIIAYLILGYLIYREKTNFGVKS